MCQRSSLVWDLRLRRGYAALMGWLTATWVLVGMAAAILIRASFVQYLLAFAIPSIALVMFGIQVSLGHYEMARARERIAALLLGMWRSALEQRRDVSLTEVRALQDAIFEIRRSASVVPRFFARLLLHRYYDEMLQASSELKSNYEEKAVSLSAQGVDH